MTFIHTFALLQIALHVNETDPILQRKKCSCNQRASLGLGKRVRSWNEGEDESKWQLELNCT